jgi:hypothetical protein
MQLGSISASDSGSDRYIYAKVVSWCMLLNSIFSVSLAHVVPSLLLLRHLSSKLVHILCIDKAVYFVIWASVIYLVRPQKADYSWQEYMFYECNIYSYMVGTGPIFFKSWDLYCRIYTSTVMMSWSSPAVLKDHSPQLQALLTAPSLELLWYHWFLKVFGSGSVA